MVTLILMPTIKPKPTAAKKASMTSPTPKVVIAMRDSTGSELKTNRTEKMAMIASGMIGGRSGLNGGGTSWLTCSPHRIW